jgi:hydrogenase/urease accessory protein HupE
VVDTLGLSVGPDGVLDPADLEAARAQVLRYLRRTIGARRGGQACPPAGEATLRLARDRRHLLYLETLRCSSTSGPLLLQDTALFEQGRYQHFARIQVGSEITTTVFSPGLARTSIPLSATARPSGRLLSTMGRYLWQGVLHIWGGIDHILFVICLLIIATELRSLLAVITAFTVAHTITLVASALGALSLSPRVVEPAIAASIIYVAVENAWALWKGRAKVATGLRRYAITFAFGLVHGFGFSYVLRDEIGLPTATLLPALLAFNVGVELGQISVVGVAWPLLRRVARTRAWRPFFYSATAAVAVVATYWLVVRLLPPA